MTAPVGRPTDRTPDVVLKLVAAFNNGFNATEACHYAGIARSAYYRWLDEDELFKDKMEEAQSAVGRKAKEVVIDSIQKGNTNDAWRWLERRDPDFKPKQEVENRTLDESRDKVKEFLDGLGTNHEPVGNSELEKATQSIS